MKRINRCDEIVKLLFATRSVNCAKAIIDVTAIKFRFGAVKFVDKLLLDEASKKVSITRPHFSAHGDSVNLFVTVTREREAVKCENEFSEANKRFGARLFVSALVKKVFESQESFMVGDNCIQTGLFSAGKLKSRRVLSA